jgi:hypothetical protein
MGGTGVIEDLVLDCGIHIHPRDTKIEDRLI